MKYTSLTESPSCPHSHRQAFRRLHLQTRIFTNLTSGNTRCTLFDETMDYPILLAPVAYHKLAHPEGELATTTGASTMKASMIVSTLSSLTLAHVLHILRTELEMAMVLTGCSSLANIDAKVLWKETV